MSIVEKPSTNLVGEQTLKEPHYKETEDLYIQTL